MTTPSTTAVSRSPGPALGADKGLDHREELIQKPSQRPAPETSRPRPQGHRAGLRAAGPLNPDDLAVALIAAASSTERCR